MNSSLVTEQRDFSIAFVMERTHERVQRVMVQLSLRIPTGCSQGALHESLKLKLLANFNNLPYFQVYLHGLGSQLWTLDARLDNGVPITSARLRNKIRETILPAFEDSLQATDFKTFCEWFKRRGVANREWMKITEDTQPFPGVTQHFWGVMSDGDELPEFIPGYADAFFGVDASGCPASGGGGRTAAPAAATAPGAAATPAVSVRAVDPEAPALA